MKLRLHLTGVALVFSIWLAAAIAAPAQTFTTLVGFDGANGGNPEAGLVQGRDGNFYGTTPLGGLRDCQNGQNDGCGTVFKITTTGALTTVHKFCTYNNRNGCVGGYFPYAELVLATDGSFYGDTSGGGRYGDGTIFKITSTGKLTTLNHFDPNGGQSPMAALLQATDGNFYGTTQGGGMSGAGTVFKITPSGTLTTLYTFCPGGPPCTDGSYLVAGLVQGTDGDFYGTTRFGGNCSIAGQGCGTIFKITPTGMLTTLYSFCSQVNCADGVWPVAGLVQGTDGNFYGTTVTTVFKITTKGMLTTLYNFCPPANCPEALGPAAPLVRATDGNFYGTTPVGGASSACNGSGCGTIFRITPAGKLTTLHSFDGTDGSAPRAALLQATNGNFYGTTSEGGAGNCNPVNCGTVFSLSVGLGPFVAFVRGSGKVGATVEILGQGLTGATGVSFNGTAANFVVHSDTYLTATVPQGATTGPVTVTTPSGTLTSNVPFRVRQ
jgi:uncharacterized repeat protein (TIGR03803 family)